MAKKIELCRNSITWQRFRFDIQVCDPPTTMDGGFSVLCFQPEAFPLSLKTSTSSVPRGNRCPSVAWDGQPIYMSNCGFEPRCCNSSSPTQPEACCNSDSPQSPAKDKTTIFIYINQKSAVFPSDQRLHTKIKYRYQLQS